MVDELNDVDKRIILAATPVPDRRARWQKLADGSIDQQELETARAKIRRGWGVLMKPLVIVPGCATMNIRSLIL